MLVLGSCSDVLDVEGCSRLLGGTGNRLLTAGFVNVDVEFDGVEFVLRWLLAGKPGLLPLPVEFELSPSYKNKQTLGYHN
jgi:hypothetical protein